jgi:hypothetical protein
VQVVVEVLHTTALVAQEETGEVAKAEMLTIRHLVRQEQQERQTLEAVAVLVVAVAALADLVVLVLLFFASPTPSLTALVLV